MAWSYILDYENSANPHDFRKFVIHLWKNRSYTQITENSRVLRVANDMMNANLKAKDALHIACATDADCDYFITTDDKIINKKPFTEKLVVLNPVEFIQKMKDVK